MSDQPATVGESWSIAASDPKGTPTASENRRVGSSEVTKTDSLETVRR
ncbi:hypothetical protein [Natronococcus amylolyticus]|nr:hypothetical protein [Natronococcus amylolyticus]